MQLIELRHGALRLALRPDLGGCIAGLWLGDVPVLRSTEGPALDSVRKSACFPLAPFSNRIAQARLLWDGTSHPLVQNFAPEEHAIHGVVWQRPWEVLEATDSFAMLACEHPADHAWPFAFDCSQTFKLAGDGLEMTLSMTNQSGKPAPAGLGWHPYFVKRTGSHIAFDATGRWEMGPDKLPTEHTATPGLDADCAALDVDHCYDGWAGSVQLHDGVLRSRLTSNLNRLVVFTNDSKDFVAVEPVSHVNNAMNIAAKTHGAAWAPGKLGIKILQPGESWSVQMAIQVERAA
jgi:aldose 1-epimerase